MITFFRRIRQKLLKANSVSKYLVYAIGEIILVVIGILIAVQINEVSQKKTNRTHVENILKNVFLNMESDMSNTVLRYIGFADYKDSLNNLVLNSPLTYADYEPSRNSNRGLTKLLEYEFEPFQFERQAYERLISNIEIIPEDYMPIVDMLQDVYTKEAPVVNEVAEEIKAFVDEIEDKYQTTYDWYSETDPQHFRQKVDYMINDPLYLNDVKRHQNLINHLLKHLQATKTYMSIAYSKIYSQYAYNEPFSEFIDQFYFPTQEEMEEFTGNYYASDDESAVFNIKSVRYYLTDDTNGVKLIKVDKNRFVPIEGGTGNYLEFNRDNNGQIESFNLAFDPIKRLYIKSK